MQTFRIFYFRDSVLQQAEEVHCSDVLEAIETARGKPAHLRVEIWSGNRRVAEIGRSPIHLSVAPAKELRVSAEPEKRLAEQKGRNPSERGCLT